MRKVNILEAKNTLSRLVEAAEAGEEIVLARAGRPAARIAPLSKVRAIRLGTGKNLIRSIPAGFDRPMTKKQIAELFGGKLEP